MVYGAHVFQVGSGRERTIVVTARPSAVPVDSVVEVTGRVRTFSRQQLEAELGVDFGPDVAGLEDATCLVATDAHPPPSSVRSAPPPRVRTTSRSEHGGPPGDLEHIKGRH